MAHKRIRVGNTKGGHLAPDLDYGSSQAVVAGDQVFLVGCTGLTLDGKNFIGEGDPAAQAETAMQNVRTLLEEAGMPVFGVVAITHCHLFRDFEIPQQSCSAPFIIRKLVNLVRIPSTGVRLARKISNSANAPCSAPPPSPNRTPT